ncbi:hypothetical protein SLEP1_g26925 [Rubroshorea leprosula]|uniref:Reverse transcriptase domain-containing protein n=1 Tax=Rubroshorea leprosula TaxID=152421 RepID=A0AAV5JRJ5_9ROSI|nr:hypothetical protein SLEP1_g26925 [Rubroshorea leprosula]
MAHSYRNSPAVSSFRSPVSSSSLPTVRPSSISTKSPSVEMLRAKLNAEIESITGVPAHPLPSASTVVQRLATQIDAPIAPTIARNCPFLGLILFPLILTQDGAKSWEDCLVGVFLGISSPNYGDIVHTVNKLWGRKGKIVVTGVGNNTYLFKISDPATRAWVLRSKIPWHVNHKILHLQQWEPNIELSKIKPTKMPLWVKIWNVPMTLYTPHGLAYIASAVGIPVSLDKTTEQRAHLNFAQVCVEVDFDTVGTLLESVFVDKDDESSVEVMFEYPWLPLPTSMVDFLQQPITNLEIKEVVFSSPRNKAPGPDGYTSEFYKAAWPVVGDLVTKAIQEFFSSGKILREMNSTIISLVPKVLNPVKMIEFRPIACCNILYKFITKILANKLKQTLPLFISKNQFAFVEGRQMVENVLLAQEVVKHYHKPQLSPRCALKKDLMKAFDSVSWDFIFQVLISLGFPAYFVNLLKICITTPMFSIVFNGNLCGYFSGKKETSEHLFFKCNYTQKIWKTLSAMASIPLTNSWQGLLHWMGKKVSRKSLQNTLVKLAWNAAVYHTWRERNRRIHQKHFKAEDEIVYEVQFDVRCKILGFAQPKSSPLPMNIAKQWGLEDVVKE